MNSQDQFWREKARKQSFIYGDRNTAYFHRMARIKASEKPITPIQDGNTDVAYLRISKVSIYISSPQGLVRYHR